MGFDAKDIVRAVEVLRAGGVILYPTDTVWGIGCDATNAEAVNRIYRIKKREDSKAMLVLVGDEPSATLRGCEAEGERPTTIIYKYAGEVAQNLRAADGTLGVRVTKEEFSRELCRRLGKPIVSTSANISGQPTAKKFSEIDANIREAVDYVCLYRRDDEEDKLPSRIIKLNEDGTVTVIRP